MKQERYRGTACSDLADFGLNWVGLLVERSIKGWFGLGCCRLSQSNPNRSTEARINPWPHLYARYKFHYSCFECPLCIMGSMHHAAMGCKHHGQNELRAVCTMSIMHHGQYELRAVCYMGSMHRGRYVPWVVCTTGSMHHGQYPPGAVCTVGSRYASGHRPLLLCRQQ